MTLSDEAVCGKDLSTTEEVIIWCLLKPGHEGECSPQPREPEKLGVWVVFDYNIGAYPIECFADEIDAHRFREQLGYGHVKFWEFGTYWTDDKGGENGARGT